MRVLALLLCGIWLALPGPFFGETAGISPVQLEAGMRVDPVGVEARGLVFSWLLEPEQPRARSVVQSAYRILVASSAQGLARTQGDIWDSGRVASPIYWQIPYQGSQLHSHTTYYWQAQVWDGKGKAGPWSQPARFTTALLSATDWSARWIAAPPDAHQAKQMPIFRRDFRLQRTPVASALLYVSGLGQYEVHLNGMNVTSTVMNPGWTNYRKTVPYDSYDVTSLLRSGANSFGVLLGNGMYNVEEEKGRYSKFSGSFGQPKCLLQLEVLYADGSSDRIVSDRYWSTAPGPITFSSIYGGEDFDAALLPQHWDLSGFRAPGWLPAAEVSGPGGALVAEQSSPMVIAETYKTVHTTMPKAGLTVYDLGENMSGWPEITARGPAGSKIILLPGELLAADGTVSQRSTNASPSDPVLFTYRLSGNGAVESWHPRFSYHSFRYVQVSVEPAEPDGQAPQVLSLAGDFVHAGVATIGSFKSSDELFDRIHTLIDRAVLSNLASVVTDCPSREKLGWLEQTYLNAGTLMLNYDVSRLYEKMSHDILDAQLGDGLVPSIAPEYVAFVDQAGKSTAFRDSPEWGSAVILSPWALYQYTGDTRPLEENYTAMQHYADYLESKSENSGGAGKLLDYGLGDWYDIGPAPPGPSQLTSRLVTATGVYYEDLTALARIAALLGHAADAVSYQQQAAAVRDAFNARLFHPDTNQYDRGSQTADALPLALGMVPAGHEQAVLANLVADIHAHHDHVTAGDIGFHYVVRALTDSGRSSVLAAMLSRTDSPSYGYQLAHGATTLTEAWDANPASSQNHFMLGHAEEWFYRGLAGLSIDMSRGPENAITLRPSLLAGVAQASASYQAPMGRVDVSWQRKGRAGTVDVVIPAGAEATLHLPPADKWIGAQQQSTSLGSGLRLSSGTYHFSTGQLRDTSPR